jgi:hypothetical protein
MPSRTFPKPATRTASSTGAAPDDDRRPLALVAVYGGAAAALIPLVAMMLFGVVGWFLTDGGIHGSPRDGLRSGALAWLMGHGSGIHVTGTAVTAMPLGLTLICALVVARVGLRTGERLSDHGPDAHALTDGERDWTVPAGATMFAATYAVLAVLVGVLAGTSSTQPALAGAFAWGLFLGGVVGGAGIAVGSGRASVWLALIPLPVRETVQAAVRILRTVLLVSAVVFVVALLLDGGTALTVLSELHTDFAGGLLFVLLSLLVLPNALLFAGSYLLGPGFQVGTGTLVSPTVVALGPVPMFPLLAALPDNGPTPFWTPFLIALPPLAAAYAVARLFRTRPALGLDVGALRGLAAGVLAAVMFGLLAGLAGGAVGPGRMRHVGPLVGSVFFHAVVALGIGGLLGGLIASWWSRRHPVLDRPVVADSPLASPAGEADDADRERTVKLPGLKLPGVSLPSVKLPGFPRSGAGSDGDETTSGETPSDR